MNTITKHKVLTFGSIISSILLLLFYILLVEINHFEFSIIKFISISIVLIYYSFGYVVGWIYLHGYTTPWLNKYPPLGLISYLGVHFLLSGYVGFFYLPYWLYLVLKNRK